MNRLQSNLKVLQTWKLAEIPPSHILQTMTINAAELLGVEKSRGVLERTSWADIIALDKDPSKDIDAIKDVRFVMKAGKIIKNDTPR